MQLLSQIAKLLFVVVVVVVSRRPTVCMTFSFFRLTGSASIDISLDNDQASLLFLLYFTLNVPSSNSTFICIEIMYQQLKVRLV